jgi:hypothetical protein
MSARVSLQAKGEQDLAERRLLGFKLGTMAHRLASCARDVANAGHGGRATLAPRLKMLRPFTDWPCLGRVTLSSTRRYLSCMPELMGLPGQAFERHASAWDNGDEQAGHSARPTELRRAGAVLLHRAPHAAARDEPAHGGNLP